MGGAVLLYQIFGDEVPPVHPHHAVKVGHDDLFDAVTPPHQVGPVGRGIDERGHRSGDPAARVGIKGKGGGDESLLGRHLSHTAQQSAVTHVHPVKKAQCNGSFCLVQWNRLSFLSRLTPGKSFSL